MKNIKILVVRFQNNITPKELPFFRGAIIQALGTDNDILFHNHTEENFRYAYPLIQYKRIHQKAAIVCIEEGAAAIGKFFATCNFNVSIGNRPQMLKMETMQPIQCEIRITDTPVTYNLRKWLPLNSDNYPKYTQLEDLDAKIQFLEKILTGNILSFAKNLGIFFTDRIVCKISTLSAPGLMTYKHIKLMSFDVEFRVNVILPDYIGLGKEASMGYGTIVRKYENQ